MRWQSHLSWVLGHGQHLPTGEERADRLQWACGGGLIRRLFQPQPHILKMDKITLMLVFVVERERVNSRSKLSPNKGLRKEPIFHHSLPSQPVNLQAQKFYELKKSFDYNSHDLLFFFTICSGNKSAGSSFINPIQFSTISRCYSPHEPPFLPNETDRFINILPKGASLQMYTSVRSGKASCSFLYVFSKRINLECADSFRRIRDLCRLILSLSLVELRVQKVQSPCF